MPIKIFLLFEILLWSPFSKGFSLNMINFLGWFFKYFLQRCRQMARSLKVWVLTLCIVLIKCLHKWRMHGLVLFSSTTSSFTFKSFLLSFTCLSLFGPCDIVVFNETSWLVLKVFTSFKYIHIDSFLLSLYPLPENIKKKNIYGYPTKLTFSEDSLAKIYMVKLLRAEHSTSQSRRIWVEINRCQIKTTVV